MIKIPTQRFGEGRNIDDWSQNIHDMIEEMHNRTFFQFRRADTWQPSINAYETETSYIVCVDLAGLEEKQVAVECVEERRIVIAGCRGKPRPEQHEGTLSVHMMEIDEGPFRREMELPQAIVADAVEAEYRKGYLWIHLPKKAK
ncbi:MAG: Hsp20/alpha crystallin family protein [Phycisphaerae bacterium]|nr:Hsp20/alpha crystallin family protein [Phycisphaerae bacterium]